MSYYSNRFMAFLVIDQKKVINLETYKYFGGNNRHTGYKVTSLL